MKTQHRLFFADARKMSAVADESVDLMVTSPPYPMIAMWDETFRNADEKIDRALREEDGSQAFELMHRRLDPVWDEVFRVLKKGGFACINIGDAVRTLKDRFTLYPNHARIVTRLYEKGFNLLPPVIWRKQTNAPNKFMGAGMLPAGAYVTLEHEYILIARKGEKRTFDKGPESHTRRESAFFWEERNLWFSDIWMDVKGARQRIRGKTLRGRSAAFPFDVPYRLINMYSVAGDTVLDPFTGSGTTLAAAATAGRNSIGYEIDAGFNEAIALRIESSVDLARILINERLEAHREFVQKRISKKGPLKHYNSYYGFPVMTAQEKSLRLPLARRVRRVASDVFEADYEDGSGCMDSNEKNSDLVAADSGKQCRGDRSIAQNTRPAGRPFIQRFPFE
jgi:modification methylase